MTIDQKKAAELFELTDKLAELHQRQGTTLTELRRAIVHEAEKGQAVGDPINPHGYKRMLRAYHRALETGVDQFKFDGHDLLVGYARHLLPYLESRLMRSFSIQDEMSVRVEHSRHRRAMKDKSNG